MQKGLTKPGLPYGADLMGSRVCTASPCFRLFPCKEALLVPVFGHPLVPRDQHVFSPSPSLETRQGTLCPFECWILHTMCSGFFSASVAGASLEAVPVVSLLFNQTMSRWVSGSAGCVWLVQSELHVRTPQEYLKIWMPRLHTEQVPSDSLWVGPRTL